MDYDLQHSEFSKAFLAGVFAGLAAVLTSLLFNFVYRYASGFFLPDIINVSSIIFIVMILCMVAGYIYYLLHHLTKSGTIIFIVASIILTVLLVMGSMNIQRSDDPILSHEFSKLLAGITIITGLCIAIGIPYLYRHDKII